MYKIIRFNRFKLSLSLLAGLLAFGAADSGDGPVKCVLAWFEGSPKVLGVDTCPQCASDTPHGDGNCGQQITSGWGTRCWEGSQGDTYVQRHPEPGGGVCIVCISDSPTSYSYAYPITADSCYVNP